MRPKKSLGQNFLIDPNYKRKIIDAVRAVRPETLIEIGPGRGVLTEELAKLDIPLILIEKDKELGKSLQERSAGHSHITVWIGDFLEYPFKVGANNPIKRGRSLCGHLPLHEKKITVVGNLPYNMASQILIRLLENSAAFTDLFLMFQKEMALRFVANPGTKDYGLMSLWAQAYTEPKIIFHLPPTVFRPQPKVASSFVHFTLLQKSLIHPEEAPFFWFLMHKLFQQRRKTLRAVLRQMDSQVWERIEASLPSNARAETLSLQALIDLALLIKKSS